MRNRKTVSKYSNDNCSKLFWKNFIIYRFVAGSNVASASCSRYEEQEDYFQLKGEHMFKSLLPTWKKSGYLEYSVQLH